MKELNYAVIKQYNYTFQNNPYEQILTPGYYLFECWGASGSNSGFDLQDEGCIFSNGGGGYTKGLIKLTTNEKFFIYVGEKGKNFVSNFNGINISSKFLGGGGATDIRLEGGDWYSFDSLKTRIIVAAGSGASERYCGGDGGGLEGNSNAILYNRTIYTTGGTQISGGSYGSYESYGHGSNGTFGMSGRGDCIDINTSIVKTCDEGPNGGSGYYGGGGTPYVGAGAGGSSFVSGLTGCDAIAKNSTEFNIYHTNQPIHYSHYYFTNAAAISGNDYFLSPAGILERGHKGDGYARITKISLIQFKCTNECKTIPSCILLLFLVIILV